MAEPQALGNNKYRLVTDAPRDPATGRRRQRTTTVTAATLTEARRAQQAWEVRHRDIDHTGTSATFNMLADRVLEHIRPHIRNQTFGNHERLLRLYLRPAFGELAVSAITTSHVDALVDRLLTVPSPRINRPLKRSTIGKILETATHVFDHAVRWDWIAKNPVTHARRPTVPHTRIHPVDPAAVAGFASWLQQHHPEFAIFFHTVSVLGCRPAELCALQWFEVDLDNGLVHIQGSIERETLAKTPTKTDRDRVVAVDASTCRLLAQHRAATGFISPDAFVFSEAPDGSRPINPGTLTVRMSRWQRQSGFKVTHRSLRHFVATQLIGAGVDVRTVAGRLGHANPAMTLQVYSAFIPANDRKAAELLAAIRGEVGSGRPSAAALLCPS